MRPVIRRDDWNDYVIRADGPRVTTWINGVQGTDYTEADPSILDWGKLGIQVHGGGKALVQVKDITIEELPPTPPGKRFFGAPEPKKSATTSPQSPADERASFTLPPGFEMELVASEDPEAGIGKFVAVDWDLQGRLWTMTALEYPVDANEAPAVAKELYASRAKDKVLVYDRDPKSPTGYAAKPRVFADGLAIPLGILPYKNGVYVQHGTEIVFLSDTDGDGKADKREVILSGFGVQDSHLFPHQFTRAPGNWIWFAQGAFNYGKVKTTKGAEVKFDQTRMAKFRYDGADFDITSQGPCNIWGLVLTAEGEAWIQEANDYGYPVMPFHEYANYPGCSDSQFKSYAPEFPGTAPDFKMGGTGLSGLALTDAQGAWPEAYSDVMYVANPITRKIQAIKITRDGPRFKYQKLPDFVQSSDEMFRPVALQLGPDGCLYVVDWYNKIISHNEVPRTHPERDKRRGRIWRIKHSEQKPFDVPDFTQLSGDELIAKLGTESTPQSHLAWQAITDRQMRELTPKLRGLVSQSSARNGHGASDRGRIAALWALEGLGALDAALLTPLLKEPNRNLRREAVRAAGEAKLAPDQLVAMLETLVEDDDPEVRAEVIRTAGRLAAKEPRAVLLAAKFARVSLAGPVAPSTQNGSRIIKVGVAYEREFERYLVRLLLEQQPKAVAEFLRSDSSKALPVENRLLVSLALEPKESASLVAQLLPQLTRPPGQEELLRLAQFPDEPGAGEALKAVLQQPATSTAAIESLLKVRTRLETAKINPLLTDAAAQLLASSEPARVSLGARLAGAFQLSTVEPQLARTVETGSPKRGEMNAALSPQTLAALQALRELKSDRVDLFVRWVEAGDGAAQDAAIAALAASRDPRGPSKLAALYPKLSMSSRRSALAGLAGTKNGAGEAARGIFAGTIPKEDLDAASLDKIQTLLGEGDSRTRLMQEMASFFRPALRLNGSDNAWVDSDLTLDGPFTVETWVKLDPGIDNNDGILGAPGVLDMNFYGGQFRVWVGANGIHDAIVSKKKITPDVWTHLAVTRSTDGQFRLFQNGELDTADSKRVPGKFAQLRIGWTAPAKGTAGWLSEFRVWNRARTPDEILADFDRSFEGESKPAGMIAYFGGSEWRQLKPGAKVQKTSEFPPLLTTSEAHALAEKLAKFRSLAEGSGDAAYGKKLFVASCLVCHQAGGQGAGFAPNLDGLGLRTTEGLLRAMLTPSAAMEAGYRAFRVETKDGEIHDGFLVSQDATGVVLRQPNVEPVKISAADVRRASFRNVSIMPEGLLEGMEPQQVKDLFAFIRSMK